MWRRKPQRPPSTYEDVRLVAEVLSRINVDLIERHFGVSGDTANEFMVRLVQERRFGGLQSDGWHYPPLRKLRVRRSRTKPKASSKSKIDESIPAQPEAMEDLPRRIAALEQERYTLRAKVKRLQDVGKTVKLATIAEVRVQFPRDQAPQCGLGLRLGERSDQTLL
jgi:hypothetical protein